MMRDGDLRFAGRAFTPAHTRGSRFCFIQQPVGLILSGQHPLHFLNQKRVPSTGALHKSLPLRGWALQCRLENLPNPPEVLRCHRLSVKTIAHFFDGCLCWPCAPLNAVSQTLTYTAWLVRSAYHNSPPMYTEPTGRSLKAGIMRRQTANL